MLTVEDEDEYAQENEDNRESFQSSENFTQKSAFLNYFRAFIIGFGCYYLGYYIGILNPMGNPLAKIVYKMEDKNEIASFVGNLNLYYSLGAMISVFVVGPLSDTIGRIKLLIICEVISIGTGYLYTIKSTTILLMTRAIGGVIAGLNSSAGPIALAEMFPSAVTGAGGLFLYFSVTSFIFLGYLSAPFCRIWS